MKRATIVCLAFGLIFLAGCATKQEPNINLPESFWQNSKQKITVAKTKGDKPQLHKKGPQGLLDIAINNVVTDKFGKYLEKLDSDWYHGLLQKFITQFKQRSILAEAYPNDIDPKQQKNGSFIVQTDGDKLLVIELQHLGAIRDYYGFIPTSNPKVYCVLKGQLIDQQDKKVLWRHVVKIEDPVQGNWDQPPHYPNFTNAFKETMASAQEEIINSFFSGH